MSTSNATDPTLWTLRPAFGVAGGPIVVALTDEGNERAWSVGARVRRGPPAKALEALRAVGGRGLLVTWVGAHGSVTDLGQFDEIAWGHLRTLGYVERDGVDGVRLTEHGVAACSDGDAERVRLLARCGRAAAYSADDAYSAELRRVFGKNAGDARYDARGTSTPELRRLSDAKLAADAAMG